MKKYFNLNSFIILMHLLLVFSYLLCVGRKRDYMGLHMNGKAGDSMWSNDLFFLSHRPRFFRTSVGLFAPSEKYCTLFFTPFFTLYINLSSKVINHYHCYSLAPYPLFFCLKAYFPCQNVIINRAKCRFHKNLLLTFSSSSPFVEKDIVKIRSQSLSQSIESRGDPSGMALSVGMVGARHSSLEESCIMASGNCCSPMANRRDREENQTKVGRTAAAASAAHSSVQNSANKSVPNCDDPDLLSGPSADGSFPNQNPPNSQQQLSPSKSTSSVENDHSHRCGIGSCSPAWLQQMHTPKWLLAVLCICAFNQSLVINAIFPVALSTLEKRFHLTSTHTGIISSWYDFAVLLAVFPVCHWGNYGHKGRWIAVGSLIMALGSMVCAVPHFISAPWEVNLSNISDYGQCTNRPHTVEQCPSAPSLLGVWYMNPSFLIFLLGQTLHGIGATPLFSLGTAYLDENVPAKSSPVYLAIHSLLTSIGPIFGLFIGGKLLTIYDDFDRVEMSTLPFTGSDDPRWVGAWWIGFVGCSIASLIISFPLMMFARELLAVKKNHGTNEKNQALSNQHQMADSDDILKAKDIGLLGKAIWNILRNPTFVAIIAIGIFESIILNGFSAFMPKILEIILSTSPDKSAYLSSVVIFAAAAGVMIGGMVVRQLRLQVSGMLRMVLISHLLAAGLITCMLMRCPAREFVGITIGYYNQTVHQHPALSISIDDPCNLDCHCGSKWDPVCDMSTGRTFYSACHAGCSAKEEIADMGTKWRDCRCLANTTYFNLSSSTDHDHDQRKSNSSSDSPYLISGYCPINCGWHLWLFLALLFCSVVASFVAGIPTQQIMLRVIPAQQRTIGIAINWTFLRLFGFVPGGVIFGYLIDSTCLRWQESDCGTKRSCLISDPHQLSWRIMALAVLCKLAAVLATIIGYLAYRTSDLDRGHLSLMVNDDRPPPPIGEQGLQQQQQEEGKDVISQKS